MCLKGYTAAVVRIGFKKMRPENQGRSHLLRAITKVTLTLSYTLPKKTNDNLSSKSIRYLDRARHRNFNPAYHCHGHHRYLDGAQL